MRVLQTTVSNPWEPDHGGGQLSVHDLSAALARGGHDVAVGFTAGPRARPPAELPYRTWFLPRRERLYLIPVAFYLRLRRIRGEIDVVHVHGFEGAFARAAVGPSVPIVATTHHPDLPPLQPVLRGSVLRRAAALHRLIVPFLERLALSGADSVAAISAYSAAHLRASGYLRCTSDVRVIHPGVRLVGNAGARPGVDLVCVGRLDRQKGFDVLLEAAARARDVITGIDILGSGPELDKLLAQRTRLKLEDIVRFRGYVASDQVASYLRGARALVMPSRSENFPRVVLEALAAGLPIVAARVGGTAEAVRDGVEALLVPPADVAGLESALRRLAVEPGLRNRLSENAILRAGAFTWEKTARDTAALYGHVAETRALRYRARPA